MLALICMKCVVGFDAHIQGVIYHSFHPFKFDSEIIKEENVATKVSCAIKCHHHSECTDFSIVKSVASHLCRLCHQTNLTQVILAIAPEDHFIPGEYVHLSN